MPYVRAAVSGGSSCGLSRLSCEEMAGYLWRSFLDALALVSCNQDGTGAALVIAS